MTALRVKLFRDLKALRVQSISVALLLMAGLSVLVSSWSSYRSLNQAKEYFYEKYYFADLFADLERAPESILSQVIRLPGVELSEARIVKMGLVNVTDIVEPALGQFISWSETKKLNQIHLLSGRYPQDSLQIEAVVHEAFAKAHEISIHDTLMVNLGGQNRSVTIVGIGISPENVYALNPASPLPDDQHFGIFWLHELQMRSLFNMEGVFNSLLLQTSSRMRMDSVKEAINNLLSPYGGFDTYDRGKQVSHMFVEDEITQQKVMSILMPVIFMTVALFILNTIISRMIQFHRPQIAALKALGYSSGALVNHYFLLVTMILVIGIIPSLFLGAGIGAWYAELYKDFFRFPVIDFSLSADAILLAFACGLFPGWLSSYFALKKVLDLNPAEALRPPNPPSYKHSALEPLLVLFQNDLSTKMILRSLFIKPVRLVVTLVGLSLSLAILVNASFWGDVINEVIRAQFQDTQREDLAVSLGDLKNRNILSDIAKLPGVLKVEGERLSSAYLLNQELKKEVIIKTFSGPSSLSRLRMDDGLEIKKIGEGVILSDYFKKQHGIKQGDRISLQLRTGSQQTLTVKVLGFSRDVMGHFAIFDHEFLSHLLHEPVLINTVKVKADPQSYQSLFIAFKKMPTVLNISVRESVLKSFNSLIGDMVLTFTFVLYLFALSISIAVIYNSGNIIFSEKSWELASLRILGFDTQKAFEVIFFEVALQILIILLPGLFLGYFLSWATTLAIQNENFEFPFIMNRETLAGAAFSFVITFLVSGFFLFRKVSKLDYSKALKARE